MVFAYIYYFSGMPKWWFSNSLCFLHILVDILSPHHLPLFILFPLLTCLFYSNVSNHHQKVSFWHLPMGLEHFRSGTIWCPRLTLYFPYSRLNQSFQSQHILNKKKIQTLSDFFKDPSSCWIENGAMRKVKWSKQTSNQVPLTGIQVRSS